MNWKKFVAFTRATCKMKNKRATSQAARSASRLQGLNHERTGQSTEECQQEPKTLTKNMGRVRALLQNQSERVKRKQNHSPPDEHI
jgi:hypothetical protein